MVLLIFKNNITLYNTKSTKETVFPGTFGAFIYITYCPLLTGTSPVFSPVVGGVVAGGVGVVFPWPPPPLVGGGVFP